MPIPDFLDCEHPCYPKFEDLHTYIHYNGKNNQQITNFFSFYFGKNYQRPLHLVTIGDLYHFFNDGEQYIVVNHATKTLEIFTPSRFNELFWKGKE